MNYTPQDLFDYSVENECPMDVHEIMDAMSMQLPTVADAFDYYLGVPIDLLRIEAEAR